METGGLQTGTGGFPGSNNISLVSNTMLVALEDLHRKLRNIIPGEGKR